MKPEVQFNKLVVFSGSGVSAESGLPTFRDSNGLWNSYSWEDVSSPQGWKRNPEAVLAFYNERRLKAWHAVPNCSPSGNRIPGDLLRCGRHHTEC
ncbi:SIR2 family NAD-dependent protein deacylase [Variovorax paradoxus]|uniref:SIR2 family NAD-dependent protein deacylase n=1 Tax=Variovorax paradoxus TaxID=34073 RepID=UPI0029C8E957|nr:Sir2 family NAD-dependent protein deacetylase [Variovorax paradoxus]